MGQKINPNILRLGVYKNWKTEFFEKKKKELPLYIFKDLEIQNFLEKFLEREKIFIHNYSQYFTNNTISLFISYFVPIKSNFNTTLSGNKKLYLLSSSFKKKSVCYNYNKNNILLEYNFFNKKLYKFKKYLKYPFKNFSFNLNKNLLENMLQIISNFMLNKVNIKITFSCINKNLNVFKIKRKIKVLKKFQAAPFYKDGLEWLFNIAFNKNSARLLAKFISVQLKTTSNRPKLLLAFIKNTLKILLFSKLCVFKGVKIVLKGRLTKGPRAKHKILVIGDVPVQKLNCNIDYFQTTTHNNKGSFGIKVWIIEK